MNILDFSEMESILPSLSLYAVIGERTFFVKISSESINVAHVYYLSRRASSLSQLISFGSPFSFFYFVYIPRRHSVVIFPASFLSVSLVSGFSTILLASY